jgi:hypothetical protein
VAQPAVYVVGARVSVLTYRSGEQTGTSLYTSQDGGASFGPAQLVGDVSIYAAAYGPGDTVSVVSNADAAGALYQDLPLSGAAAAQHAVLGGFPREYNGAIGLIAGTTPLAIFTDASSIGAFQRFLGGDPNNAASWSAPSDIGYVDYPRLAGGPRGLFLLAGDESGGMFVRRFDGTTFGPRVPVTAGDASEASLFEDPAGGLHAVYPRLDASGYHAVHAISDNGTSWRSEELDVQAAGQQSKMRVAAAADHIGVAVWSLNSQIVVAPVGPVPEFHKSVVVGPVSGTIRVRMPGSSKFTVLKDDTSVPLKATIDSKRGVLELSSAPSAKAKAQTIRLSKGLFKVTQPGKITDFALNEPLASCRAHAAAAKKKKSKSRRLFGNGKGSFRTSGRYSAATIRGTRWYVQDTCAGTLTRVLQGSVRVRDKVRHRTVIVRAGKRYLARPRRR